jgi:hypothetical protein
MVSFVSAPLVDGELAVSCQTLPPQMAVKSRPKLELDARVGTGTPVHDVGNPSVAVCVLPGSELAFAHEIKRLPARLWPCRDAAIGHKTAIFRQINKDRIAAHHDALEFPDGEIVLLTLLAEGQEATVLQLPAEPETAAEAEAQRRTAYVG